MSQLIAPVESDTWSARRNPVKQRVATTLRAPLRSKRPTGHAKQPRKLPDRNIIKPAPRDLKRPRERVLSAITISAAQQIRRNATVMLIIKALKPPLVRLVEHQAS